MLISWGHGTLRRDELTRLVCSADIEALVDIRRFPHNRHNPDVEGNALSSWLAEAGMAIATSPGSADDDAQPLMPCPRTRGGGPTIQRVRGLHTGLHHFLTPPTRAEYIARRNNVARRTQPRHRRSHRNGAV